MRDAGRSPGDFLATFTRNIGLIRTLAVRQVVGRYRGSFGGIFWSFLSPLIMLAIYTFVFGVILRARWDGASPGMAEFAILLFVGLIVFNLFAELVGGSPFLVTSNASYVKKMIFPVEILPLVSAASAVFHALVSMAVLLAFSLAMGFIPQPTFALFPLLIAPVLFFSLGLAWVFASLGVYFRDIGQIIGLFTTAFMFLSPVFYPLSFIPTKFQPLFHANPLTTVIESSRNATLLGGPLTSPAYWWVLAGSLLVAYLGFAWFQSVRRGFADVI